MLIYLSHILQIVIVADYYNLLQIMLIFLESKF